MKNKGFTLVEIIAVIVIMGILLLIVVPATSNLLKSNDEKKYSTYYEILEKGLEKYGRTRRNDIGGSTGSGCFDDKNLKDLIKMGYVKEFDQEDDIFCGTPNEFDQNMLNSWDIDTTKEYANMRVEGNEGEVRVKISLICVKTNSDGTFASEPEYIKLVEGADCNSFNSFISCDSGYSYISSTGVCEKRYAPDSSCDCPSGYTLSGTTCTMKEQNNPICSSGTYNSASDDCVSTSQTNSVPKITGGSWAWQKAQPGTSLYSTNFQSTYGTYQDFCSSCDYHFVEDCYCEYCPKGARPICNSSRNGMAIVTCPCGNARNDACLIEAGNWLCREETSNNCANGITGYGRAFFVCQNVGGTTSYSCSQSNCTLNPSNNQLCNCTNHIAASCPSGFTLNKSTNKCEKISTTTCTMTNFSCATGNTHAGATTTLSQDNSTCTSTYIP